MRENRTYGSEGGEARAFPTPIQQPAPAPTTNTNTRHQPVPMDNCAPRNIAPSLNAIVTSPS